MLNISSAAIQHFQIIYLFVNHCCKYPLLFCIINWIGLEKWSFLYYFHSFSIIPYFWLFIANGKRLSKWKTQTNKSHENIKFWMVSTMYIVQVMERKSYSFQAELNFPPKKPNTIVIQRANILSSPRMHTMLSGYD